MVLATAAYERREQANYWRAGLVASAIYNVNRKKGKKALKPDDFIPRRKRRRRQTPQQMAALLKAATLALGGEVIDGD